jgi:hemerythrin superfamily protein
MDAITLLKQDHKTVEDLFKRFEDTGDRAYVERRRIVDEITEELSVHAAIEEQLFYPVTREVVPEVEDLALEGLEEHHIVKWVLHELEDLPADHERFEAKVTVLIENVRHHVEEEEGDYFPKVRDALGRNALNELGDAMLDAKRTAPRRPHPRLPDTPPANIVGGAAAGVVDRVTGTVSGIAQGAAAGVGDVVARVKGEPKPRRAPSGSSDAQRTATTVRNQFQVTLDKVTDAIDKAETTGKETAKAARAGTKATATSARKGAKRTGSTAKGAATKTARAAKQAADA